MSEIKEGGTLRAVQGVGPDEVLDVLAGVLPGLREGPLEGAQAFLEFAILFHFPQQRSNLYILISSISPVSIPLPTRASPR